MRIDYNECMYSCGSDNPHSACTHQNYCIFNENQTILESKIAELERELNEVENQLTQYHLIYTNKDYYELLDEKTLLVNDLEELRQLRNYIIDNEVKIYGFEVLES